MPPTDVLNILHLEDSPVDHDLVSRTLKRTGFAHTITRVETLIDFLNYVGTGAFSLVIADYRLPGFTAIDAWLALPETTDRPPFILLSGAIGEAAAVTAIQTGISDYLHKDEIARLERVISRTMEMHRTRRAKAEVDRELALSEKRLSDLTGHLQTAIDRERAAIAREIHDDIGGSLAAANLDIAWITRHVSDPALLEHAQAATDMLQHAMGASQRIMMDLRPAVLDQGLLAAIQWLASCSERRSSMKIVVRSNCEDLHPDKAVQLVAYRTAQEALTNVTKYAKCSLVQIEISNAGNVLTLEVCDNGVGITREEMMKPHAFGIRGLQERAKTVGGWLDVSTQSGRGTTITLSVPMASMPSTPAETQFQ